MLLQLLLLLTLSLKVLPVFQVGSAASGHGADGGKDVEQQLVAGQTDAHDEPDLDGAVLAVIIQLQGGQCLVTLRTGCLFNIDLVRILSDGLYRHG